jgi:hypothetical protein
MTYRRRDTPRAGENPSSRQCSRPGCGIEARATLTYDYAQRRAWIDRLAEEHPMAYNLCEQHADGLSVPLGWELQDRRPPPAFAGERSTLAS